MYDIIQMDGRTDRQTDRQTDRSIDSFIDRSFVSHMLCRLFPELGQCTRRTSCGAGLKFERSTPFSRLSLRCIYIEYKHLAAAGG